MKQKPLTPYEAGKDCALHGPNLTNCNMLFFNTAENTKQWEAGKKEAGKATIHGDHADQGTHAHQGDHAPSKATIHGGHHHVKSRSHDTTL